MKIVIPIVENEVKNIDPPYCRSLYEIERKTIIQYICEALLKIKDADYVFILNKLDVDKYHLDYVVRLLIPSANIVIAQGNTMGSACSCLLGMDYFKMDEPMIIIGGDQLLMINIQDIIDEFMLENYDGGVIIFDDIHPRWSYVKLNEDGFVIEAAEKRPISHNATTGFYYFKRTDYFVNSAFKMIKKEASVNGKFYVCPIYNEMILEQKKIGVHRICKEQYFNFNHTKGIELFEEYKRKEKNENK